MCVPKKFHEFWPKKILFPLQKFPRDWEQVKDQRID